MKRKKKTRIILINLAPMTSKQPYHFYHPDAKFHHKSVNQKTNALETHWLVSQHNWHIGKNRCVHTDSYHIYINPSISVYTHIYHTKVFDKWRHKFLFELRGKFDQFGLNTRVFFEFVQTVQWDNPRKTRSITRIQYWWVQS